MGTLDANGIYIFEETDSVSPLHTTLNTAQAATSAVVETINDNIDNINLILNGVVANVPQNVSYASGWGSYDNNLQPRVILANGLVFFTGGRVSRVSTNQSLTNTTDVTFLTVPASYRPETNFIASGGGFVHYGSGIPVSAKISVHPNGNVVVRPDTGGTLTTAAAFFVEAPPMFWIPGN